MMQDFISKFTSFYGSAPTAAAMAPGRLEILGNHTDYNQGFVLSCAVAQNTAFALRRKEGTVCTLRDFRSGKTMTFDLANLDDVPSNGSRYVKGMVKELAKRGFKVTAFDAAIESTVPLSAGMSSSAALETAAGYAIGREFGIELDKAEWARCGQGVENNYLGLKSGLLDQFSSIFGRKESMILSDFRTVEVLKTAALPPGYCIVVINSMKKHNLVDSEYNVRRADCEAAAKVMNRLVPGAATLRDISLEQLAEAKNEMSDREYRRALHVVGECTRVMDGIKMLEAGDIAGFGNSWFESHFSSRDNFENSTPELDYLVELARSIPGCLGARLSGGGFGGITIHLVEATAAEEYAKRVSTAYQSKTGVAAETIICNIGDGAKLIEL
ncbi:MAG: galactokinase [Lentisphaeria bacterium]|nr:galactokinase [Lentisphaeria bacterium]